MPLMESDWQRRRHPPHDTSMSSTTLPTLPGVAELIASSTPASATISAYHHSTNPLPPIMSSAPHNPPSTAASANAASSTEQSYPGPAARYPSHASPTDSATSPTTAAATERHFYQHSSQSSGPTPGASFESYPSLDGAAHHAPNNTRRQDSAIAHHHRLESSKEGPPFAPLSEPDVSYSHRSPTISRPSTSPAPCSHHSSQSPAHVPSSLHTSTRSDEHVTGQPASPRFQPAQDPSPKSLSPPLSLDHSNTSNSNIRQQRYNVRFAANYTSENMSPAHRPRPSSPLQTAAAATETNESLPSTQPERAASTIDPILQNILTGTSSHPDVQSQADYLAQELKVERCPGCNEAWSRPPVHASEWGSQSPATSVHDFEKAQGNVLSRLRKFEKENDEAFDQWKKKHSQCPIIPTAPPRSAAPNAQSNKRKPEGLHSDITKLRRMNFDSNGPTAPLARPSAPI